MINIAVVDDDAEERELLRAYTERICTDYRAENGCPVLYDITCFADGISFVTDYVPKYDIVLLDIEMPILDGLSTARRLRQMDRQISIIFVSVSSRYALSGYEAEAADYLLKPVQYPALANRMRKLIRASEGHSRADIFLNIDDGCVRVNLCDIVYIEKEKHDIVFHLAAGEYRGRMNLKEVEGIFLRNNFIKCNRGCLVNLDAIEKISGGCVYVRGKTLSISRGMAKPFFSQFSEYAAALSKSKRGG